MSHEKQSHQLLRINSEEMVLNNLLTLHEKHAPTEVAQHLIP